MSPRIRFSLAERLWRQARREDSCLIFTGALDGKGEYGRIVESRFGHRRVLTAHRLAYELTYGPIPAGMVIDHRCRRRQCIEPTHLEAVSPSTNAYRRHKPVSLDLEPVSETSAAPGQLELELSPWEETA